MTAETKSLDYKKEDPQQELDPYQDSKKQSMYSTDTHTNSYQSVFTES